MNELSRHIEILLLENDCVIVPGFGGFIAHHSNARRVEEENLFLPPIRTIGFNPQLVINDGLLVQSYMKAYDTDFADASKRVDNAIEELKHSLHKNGEFDIHGVGRLTVGMNSVYEFRPNEDGLLSPGLYGLSSFTIGSLNTGVQNERKEVSEKKHSEKVYEIKISRTFIRHTAAAAAAIIAFFFLSVPAENTYVEEENYATLDAGGIFENIRTQSMLTSLFPTETESRADRKTPQNPVGKPGRTASGNPLKPVSVRTEKVSPRELKKEHATENVRVKANAVPPSAKADTPQKVLSVATPKYNIIVASVGTRKDAESMVAAWKAKGYPTATVIEGDGKIRVSLLSYPTESDAYRKINLLKQEGMFKDAWVLTTK